MSKIKEYLEDMKEATLDEFRAAVEIFDIESLNFFLTAMFGADIKYTAEQSGYKENFLKEMLFDMIFEDHDEPMIDAYNFVHGVSMEHDW